jgi:hypothetical protein
MMLECTFLGDMPKYPTCDIHHKKKPDERQLRPGVANSIVLIGSMPAVLGHFRRRRASIWSQSHIVLSGRRAGPVKDNRR